MVAHSGLCVGNSAHPSRDRISRQDLFGALQEIRSCGGLEDWPGPHRCSE